MNKLPIGMLLLPSLRSIAYLNIFRSLGVVPEEFIIMGGEPSRLDDVRAEDEKYGYSKMFFDINLDVEEMTGHADRVVRIEATNANDPAVHNALDACRCSSFLFTGGGILSKETLGRGKKFIHSHPGLLPRFRGSTCFYYSLLAEGNVGATTFIMAEGIDTGHTHASTAFRVNYRIEPDQPLFMDYILDPYIRSISLKKTLSEYVQEGVFVHHSQDEYNKPAYYVMHPLLRHLALQKSNGAFDARVPAGIHDIGN